MKKNVLAAVFAVALVGFALPAASQQTALPFGGNEISLLGTWEDRKDPDIETSNVVLRYGRFFRPQIVGTVGLRYSSSEVPGTADQSAMAALVGAKYYFSVPRAQAIVPFIDGAIGLAHTDTGPEDSTDLTWEIGGGVSWFFTQAWSFDAGLRFFHTDTDIETKGTQLFVGITARF
jgi:opacity protein-like surface antigen